MASKLLSKRRLIFENKLKEGEIGVIAGFLRSIRNMGRLNFGVICDFSGSMQVLFKKDPCIGRESVVAVNGVLQRRKNPNLNVPLGEWELVVNDYEIISPSHKNLPFELTSKSDPSLEPNRLKYRYLDLRRNNCRNLISKFRVMDIMRRHLIDNSFIEVQTPSLSVPSREGANSFDVYFYREGIKSKFSLSQSPQLYKQLLMMGGMEKYFQFANCFRLEDLRSDRQYEFLQLDIEIAYFDREYLFSMIETMMKKILKKEFNIKISTPFKRIPYNVCLEKYGSDKPDIRYELIIETLNLQKLIEINNHTEAYGIFLENCSVHVIEDKGLKSIKTKNKIYLVSSEEGKIVKVHLMDKNMSVYEGEELHPGMEIGKTKKTGVGIVVTTCGKTKKNALISLGNLRAHFSRAPKGILKNMFEFIGVVDGPLFEGNEAQNKGCISHHIFTRPESNQVNFNIHTEKGAGYDLVLNGVELASGSQRNYLLDVQKAVFVASGMSEEDIKKDFGGFLEAFNYGVPPHMGIAIGIDRLMQILLNTDSIRDVIAFPKNNKGVCTMTKSPISD